MKQLGIIIAGYVAMAMLLLMLLVTLFTGGPQGLCESATVPEVLLELIHLQRMGCPADVVMMVLSYIRDEKPDEEYTPVVVGLRFLQLRVAVEVLECDCSASTPQVPDANGNVPDTPDCTCDYEFDRVEEYNSPDEIIAYLSVLGELPEPLSAANLQERCGLAAAAQCDRSGADDRATAVVQPVTYTDSGYRVAIEQCDVAGAKDIDGILELHREGAFIEFLTQESKRLGFAEDDYIGRYPVPAQGGITCPFGYRIHPITNKPNFHKGIDIGTQWHTGIATIANGTVVGRGSDEYDGRYILIRHDDGVPFYSYYAHLSQWQVNINETVEAGEIIGLEGGDPSDPQPGYSTGHHLHFEIRMSESGGQVNPLSFLKQQKEDDP